METTREKGPLAVARSSRAREQVLSRWQGTLGELRELAGMPEKGGPWGACGLNGLKPNRAGFKSCWAADSLNGLKR